METSSRTCRVTTPSSTRWLSTLMACWCLEVITKPVIGCFQINLRVEISLITFVVFAADNGTIHMWDWRTGYNFQRIHAAVQPGSLDSESGIFACMFDHSESRLITAEADKTIKVYKEDDTAVRLTQFKCFSYGLSQQVDHLSTVLFPCRQKKVTRSTGNQRSSRGKDSNFVLFLFLIF